MRRNPPQTWSGYLVTIFTGVIAAVVAGIILYHLGYRNSGSTSGDLLPPSANGTPSAATREAPTRLSPTVADKPDSTLQLREFQEKYMTDLPEAGKSEPRRVVALALKGDAAGIALSDLLREQLSSLVQRSKRRLLPASFKPAFYSDGLFDAAWNGDRSSLMRLDPHGAWDFLFVRATFSKATPTDFPSFVSVRGTLSVLMIGKDGVGGPWVQTASGAGVDAHNAAMACATRLVGQLFEKGVFKDR